MFETRLLSSLVKVFADEELAAEPHRAQSALWNERVSFQLAYRSDRLEKPVFVEVGSELAALTSVRSVGLVPSELPCRDDHDEFVLRTTPGLYPDPLYPLDPEKGVVAFPGQWRSLWVTVELDGRVRPGRHELAIDLRNGAGERLGGERFELEVIPASLAPQRLVHTEWLHTDCIADYYRVEPWSERHWSLVERFIRTAVRNGVNMILTPIFTPPLDTAVGGERTTVQLVGVERSGREYRFDFTKLERWVEMCRRAGVEYFELSHLFTQWGARHAPKIMGSEGGMLRRLFGWETDATGDDYRGFLDQFLPRLLSFLREHGLEKRSYFHVSDEPRASDLDHYRRAAELVRLRLAEFPIIDALSDYELYAEGVVKNPIPASDHIGSFIANGVRPLWTYYCVSQNKRVPNRFFHMPSARNRVLGVLLYKFSVEGLLHWGYNFYNAQYSLRAIDPYRVTDAGHAFPSGDPFIVYPGEEGAVESLRLVVLNEALEDLRALELLESLAGREEAMAVVEEGLSAPLAFDEYPRSDEWLLGLRKRVNEAIARRTRGAAR